MRSFPRQTPILLRVYRTTRFGLHLIEGALTTALLFPLLRPRTQRFMVRAWSRRLLRTLRVEMCVHGVLCTTEGNVLLVANHVSWLDIFVLNAVHPVRFVAKAELARWPIVGRTLRRVGTLFVERARKQDARRVNADTSAALARGDVVAVFPEGRTTDGHDVLPFKSSLLQPIVDARGHVQPVAIRYRAATGETSMLPAYVGNLSLLASLWRITAAPSLIVDLHAPPRLAAAETSHRRELARAAETAIRMALAEAPATLAPNGFSGPVTVGR